LGSHALVVRVRLKHANEETNETHDRPHGSSFSVQFLVGTEDAFTIFKPRRNT